MPKIFFKALEKHQALFTVAKPIYFGLTPAYVNNAPNQFKLGLRLVPQGW